MSLETETHAIPTRILTPEGLIPTPYVAQSLAQAVQYEPRGVYTVARTFHGDRALLLDSHLDRLEYSARLVDIPLSLNRARLRQALRSLLHEAAFPDAKFRVTIPRDHPDWMYLSIEQVQPVPEAILRDGAHLVTTPLVRENPAAKTTDWMMVRQPTAASLPDGVYEALLVDRDGYVLEGLSSNFYGVIAGVLHTAGTGVLEGITRRAIITISHDIVPVELTAVRTSDLPLLSEAMMTSSSRGVVPVTRIDGQPVGDGFVGPIVQALRERYNQWTDTHAEPI